MSLLILQLIALLCITILQYTWLNHLEAPQYQSTGDSVYVYGYLPSARGDDGSGRVSPVLPIAWLALIVVSVLLVIHVSNMASALLKRILKRLYHRVTIYNLFMVKFTIPCVSFVLIALFVIPLPQIYILLPLNAGMAIFSILAFALQYYMVRRHNTKIPDIF